ncbi:hypothetical protein [Aequorivita ciconiae]|uniref:hypothetical protein n=1 Tax=Aequorivita ciconiae TaxID=2494375 RepID=UPI0026B9C6E7|nr:hypothetical protein [Aequorivita sp. H23M31]
MKIQKFDGRKRGLITYTNYQQAKSELLRITEENQLCPKLTGLQPTENECSYYSAGNCLGACINEETPEKYNERVLSLLKNLGFEKQSLLLIDRGRSTEERSVIWIENGSYKGYAFFNLNHQINRPEILKTIINPSQFHRESTHIIQNYLQKNKVLKTINLAPHSVN